MYVAELLAIVSDNMPSDISDGSIINWINVLEDTVYSKVVSNLDVLPYISDDGLSERERHKPELKTLENAEMQQLDLEKFGYRWIIMYEYYIYSQISLLKEEFSKANNYIALYNSLIDEFFAFYNSRYVTDREWR